jgi:hypothetical protein
MRIRKVVRCHEVAFNRRILVFSAVGLMAAAVHQRRAVAQSTGESDLRKELEQPKNQVKTLQNELDKIKTMLREQAARSNPVIDITSYPAMGDAGAKLVRVQVLGF